MRMTAVRFFVIGLTLLALLPTVVAEAQASRRDLIVEFSRSDSIAIEREAIALVQTSLRGIFRERSDSARVVVGHADGRERVGRQPVLAKLHDERLPGILRGGLTAPELLVELGEYQHQDHDIVTVNVRLLGPVDKGCQSFKAGVRREGTAWKRYVLGSYPPGCETERPDRMR